MEDVVEGLVVKVVVDEDTVVDVGVLVLNMVRVATSELTGYGDVEGVDVLGSLKTA